MEVSARNAAGKSGAASILLHLQDPGSIKISITDPSPNQQFAQLADAFVNASIQAPAGLKAFCYRFNDATPVTFADCDNRDELNGVSGTYSFFRRNIGSQLRQGENHLVLYAFDANERVVSASVEFETPIDSRVIGIEATQGIQELSLPKPKDGIASYAGVPLMLGGRTIVRVFANLDGFGGSVSRATATLTGFTRKVGASYTQELGVLLPDNGPLGLATGGSDVPTDVRADPDGGFVFTLPHSWTVNPKLQLRAEINPPIIGFGGVPRPPIECVGCGNNNILTLTDINFSIPKTVEISPVRIVWTDSAGREIAPSDPPYGIFERMRWISPLAENGLYVSPYVATIDATRFIKNDACDNVCVGEIHALVTRAEIANYPGFTVGVSRGLGIGLEYPETYGRFPLLNWEPVAVVDEGPAPGHATAARPLSIVAHEVYHSIGFYHAGEKCGASISTSWPPDGRGDIQGVGLDRRGSARTHTGSYPVLYPGAKGMPAEIVDLMSYCLSGPPLKATGDYNVWISTRNWERFGNIFANAYPLPGMAKRGNSSEPATVTGANWASAPEGTIDLSMLLDRADTATVLNVSPTADVRAPTLEQLSPYKIHVLKSGREIFSTNVFPVETHVPGGSSVKEIGVRVPRGDEILLTNLDRLVAKIERTKSVPTIRLVGPRPRSRLKIGQQVTLAWETRDADGDSVAVNIEASTDSGKSFVPLLMNAHSSRASFSPSDFPANSHVRLRLTASDGFNYSSTLAPEFSTSGFRGDLRIVSPSAGEVLRSDVPFSTLATGVSGDRRRLDVSAARWTLDGKLVGRGEALDGLVGTPGKHKLTVSVGALRTTLVVDVQDHGRPLAQNNSKPDADSSSGRGLGTWIFAGFAGVLLAIALGVVVRRRTRRP